MSRQILGPLQTKWVERLEKYPERQLKGRLGIKFNDGSYRVCCLGEAHLMICEHLNIEPNWKDNLLETQTGNLAGLENDSITVQTLGLINGLGRLKYNTPDYKPSLAVMNDTDMTWSEIAAYIRANPENVFTKSV